LKNRPVSGRSSNTWSHPMDMNMNNAMLRKSDLGLHRARMVQGGTMTLNLICVTMSYLM
jgi:hypothetical protein